ncbi:Mrp/NBP35 family ATP-binding protein [Candidatus Bipolaricaulota bacterium]|nr:Mrp/NBP35 family ATP-binding protein [Candidatus Bipolaricaulota bacterium]
MKNVKRVLMVLSGKGGVGKSTVAVNVATALAHRLRVGLLDADLHGPNVPKMLGLEGATLMIRDNKIVPAVTPHNLAVVSLSFALPAPNVPVIWRGPLKMKAIRQFVEDVEWGDLDLLVVDLPPGTGDEPLSVAQLLAPVDAALVVVTPQEVALLDARKAVNFARQVNVRKIAVVENMAELRCPHCGGSIKLFGQDGGEKMAAEMGVAFLGRLPFFPEVVAAGDSGRPLDFGDPARRAFLDLAEKVWEFVDGV